MVLMVTKLSEDFTPAAGSILHLEDDGMKLLVFDFEYKIEIHTSVCFCFWIKFS